MGQSLGASYGNGVSNGLAYYSVSKRLQTLNTSKNGNTSQWLGYTYDKVANVTSITDGVHPSGPESATISSAQYDGLHRLTSLTRPTGAIAFSYSPVGNLLSNDEGTNTYSYGTTTPQRMPHAVKKTTISGQGDQYYGYDANGNMILRGRQRLFYDSEKRLMQVITPNGTNGFFTNTFGYSGNGERLWKQGTNGLQVWIDGIYEEKNGTNLLHILAGSTVVCTLSTDGALTEYYCGVPALLRVTGTG